MKGLIMKDFINLKKNIKIFGILIIAYSAMSYVMEDTSFFSSIITMLTAILTLSSYSYDDIAKWDVFALTMPISKDELVQVKYIMMLLLTLIGSMIGGIFTIIMNSIRHSTSIFSGFDSIGAGVAIVILFYSIIIPFITKLGVEKARLILFMVYGIPFLIVVGLSKVAGYGTKVIPDGVMSLVDFSIKYVYIIVPVILVFALVISYKISIMIYHRKEFY